MDRQGWDDPSDTNKDATRTGKKVDLIPRQFGRVSVDQIDS